MNHHLLAADLTQSSESLCAFLEFCCVTQLKYTDQILVSARDSKVCCYFCDTKL